MTNSQIVIPSTVYGVRSPVLWERVDNRHSFIFIVIVEVGNWVKFLSLAEEEYFVSVRQMRSRSS